MTFYIAVTALGFLAGRTVGWPVLALLSVVLAVAVGVEGAMHRAPLKDALIRAVTTVAVLQFSFALALIWEGVRNRRSDRDR